jgi:hypothetical protein
VVCAQPGSWVCIEEPEIHLHPDAQAKLFDFIMRQSTAKRILVATHSPVIASCASIDSVLLVSRDSDDASVSTVSSVDVINIPRILDELGIKPSYNFEADALIFIEDKNGASIFEGWAKQVGLDGRVQFVGAEGWNNMNYFANAKIIRSRRVRTQVFVIFDGDTERGPRSRKIKERLVTELELPEDHILTLAQSEVEGYLLSPKPILAAFPGLARIMSEEELEKFLVPYRGRRNQRGALEELFKVSGIGHYDSAAGTKIAQQLKDVPADIKSFLLSVSKSIQN